MKKLAFLALLCGLPLCAQTTTYTGTIKDLTGATVTSGRITWQLNAPSGGNIPGTGAFVSTIVSCGINGSGAPVSSSDGVSPCVITNNTAITPTGTSYVLCIQAYNVTPGSCYTTFATGGTVNISTLVPTPATQPNYGVASTVNSNHWTAYQYFDGGSTALSATANTPQTMAGPLIAPNLLYPSNGYTFWIAGGVTYARNNATLLIDFSGTDSAAVIRSAIANNASICGHLIFEPGAYTLNSLAQESLLGFTNYYAIGLPQLGGSSACQWYVEGDQSSWNNTTTGPGTVVFNVTPTAVGSVSGSAQIMGFWTRPSTGITTDVLYKNITVLFPNNQRGNETAIDNTQALSARTDNVVVGFSTFPSSTFPVAGTIGLVGITTTESSKNFNDFRFTSSQGFYTAFDIQSELTHLDEVFASRTHDCFHVGFGAGSGLIYHAQHWGTVTCQFYTQGLTLGPNTTQGSTLDIDELDFGDVTGAPWTVSYHAKETNTGYTYGSLHFDIVTTSPQAIANIFDGGGGYNFSVKGYGEDTMAGTAQVKNLVPDSDIKFGSTYWTLGANMSVQNALGVGGTNAIVISSAGSGSTAVAKTVPFNLICGQPYILSAYIDASAVTSGTPSFSIEDTGLVNIYAAFGQFPGSKGEVSAAFTFSPAACTVGNAYQVVGVFATNSAAITATKFILWSAPMVQGGSVVRPYMANSGDDATGHLLLGATATAFGSATLATGTVTVSNTAACTPSASCVYKLTNCAKNASTGIGTLGIGSVTPGTSFVINSLSPSATVLTTDLSTACWQIN